MGLCRIHSTEKTGSSVALVSLFMHSPSITWISLTALARLITTSLSPDLAFGLSRIRVLMKKTHWKVLRESGINGTWCFLQFAGRKGFWDVCLQEQWASIEKQGLWAMGFARQSAGSFHIQPRKFLLTFKLKKGFSIRSSESFVIKRKTAACSPGLPLGEQRDACPPCMHLLLSK